jgi:dihydrofolate reductase
LNANVPATVAELKRSRDDGNIGILGSGELIRSLMAHDLIDEFVLPIHPVVLGSGRRMFSGGGPPTSLRLVQSAITTTGVVIAVYRRAASTARADGG